MYAYFYSILYPIKWASGGSLPLAKTTTSGENKTTTDGILKTRTLI
jgi:hypothetical protein